MLLKLRISVEKKFLKVCNNRKMAIFGYVQILKIVLVYVYIFIDLGKKASKL